MPFLFYCAQKCIAKGLVGLIHQLNYENMWRQLKNFIPTGNCV